MAKGLSGKRAFMTYAGAVAEATRGHVPVYAPMRDPHFQAAVFTVPYRDETYSVRLTHDSAGGPPLSYRIFDAKRRMVDEDEPSTLPKPNVLGATLRTVLRMAYDYEHPRRRSRPSHGSRKR